MIDPNNTKKMTEFQPARDDTEIDLIEFLAILMDGRWIILWVASLILLLGVAKAFLDEPIYKADAILQVDDKPKILIGMKQLDDTYQGNLTALAEVELIKSRKVLGEAIRNLNLDIEVSPKYFPIIGKTIASQFQKEAEENHRKSSLNNISVLAQYAWGGESIQIDMLSIPKSLRDKELLLQAGEQGYFQIIYDEQIILDGIVGKLISKPIQDVEGVFEIRIIRLEANPGTYFTLKQFSENKAINLLKENLSVAEKNKLTGILELTFESKSPEMAARILNEIASIYVQQNVEHKYAEAHQTLEFLEEQLPILQKRKDEAVNALNVYKNSKGSVDFTTETTNVLSDLVNLQTQTTLLEHKRDELRQTYTQSHPNVIAIDKQIARLKAQIKSRDNMIKALPETQQVILGLSGDVQISSNLYNTLFDKAQALKVTKAGTVGDVRVIDYAIVPNIPIKPKKEFIIVIALVIGVILGIAIVFIRKMLRRGMDDPDLIEKQLNVPVYATITYSKNQEILNKKIDKPNAHQNNDSLLLAKSYSEDSAIESLRSFRTTLHFSLLDAKNNIILISGPSPNVGKSFVSANLAAVVSDSGKKVLLIDADLRKGAIHKLLRVKRERGLSEIILNATSIEKATHNIPVANIDFIATGTLPPNPSELLLHERFGALLEALTVRYDLIIIDSPPILAATDAAIISRFASATFMVIKAGLHTRRELDQSIKRFSQSGTNIKGIVFNGMLETSSRYGYSYNRYVYQYSYKNTKR